MPSIEVGTIGGGTIGVYDYSTNPGDYARKFVRTYTSNAVLNIDGELDTVHLGVPYAYSTNPGDYAWKFVRTSTYTSNAVHNTGHTSKAILNIDGELDTVAVSPWTQEEIDNKRKLVQFWRNQKEATINTNFAVVSTSERQPNSICISCIYWEEKGECYLTSVDCIYLLESLISVRFTVEEKNRIRRNLEGFRPLTVSKAKADSENFFKLIMAFPNPKPRNIEKDVRVFPWKILGLLLKEIIGKYSVIHSSTAAVLPQAPNQQSYQAAQGNDGLQKAIDNAAGERAFV